MSAASFRLARALLDAPSVSQVRQVLDHEPSFWLRARLARIDTAAINGRLSVCGHVTIRRLGTSPGIVPLWAPDTLWCVTCAPAALRLVGAANYECDRCGAHADPIQVCTIAGRYAVVVFGLCDECQRREVAR